MNRTFLLQVAALAGNMRTIRWKNRLSLITCQETLCNFPWVRPDSTWPYRRSTCSRDGVRTARNELIHEEDSSVWCKKKKKNKLANSYLYIRLELATCPGCTSSAHRCSRPPGRCPRGALTDLKWIVVSPWENSGSWVACFFFIQEKQSFLCGFLLVLLLMLNDLFAEIPRQADLSLFFFFLLFPEGHVFHPVLHEFNGLSIWISLTCVRRFPSGSFPLTCCHWAVAKSNFPVSNSAAVFGVMTCQSNPPDVLCCKYKVFKVFDGEAEETQQFQLRKEWLFFACVLPS